MNAQMTDRLFGDSFVMMHFEITFEGVKSWFNMTGYCMDDATLFRMLLLPEYFPEEKQAEMLRNIVYRYEDVFFQANRNGIGDEHESDPQSDSTEPIHQLLLKMMNKRTLLGEDNALLDLYVILQEDKQCVEPRYPSLHALFDRKWDTYASA
jgi:hypothetical protein